MPNIRNSSICAGSGGKIIGGCVQVWYEWALQAPTPSKVHNAGGHAYAIKLAAG